MELVYLASPYSHVSRGMREWRFRVASAAASHLMAQGVGVFSPIAHTHPIAEFGLPKGWEFWEQYDRLMLDKCDRMIVLTMEGWKESKGVRAEIEIMLEAGKPVEYLDASDAIDAVRQQDFER